MFIGRYEHLDELEKALNKKRKMLISIIGRRGVGKTTLLNEFYKKTQKNDKNVVLFLSGEKNANKKDLIKKSAFQLKKIFENENFKDVINQKELKDKIKEINEENEWFVFFDVLEDLIKKTNNQNKKVIVLIDEFAWMHSPRSNFIDSFGSFWNKMTHSNVLFCLTGSAVAWMNKNLINTSGGLHGRVDFVINLKPFTFLETVDYLYHKKKEYNMKEFIQYYFFTGGVARYLDRIEESESINENAMRIFNNQTSALGTEFNELFNSSFEGRNEVHKKIVELFEKNNKLEVDKILNEFKNKEGFSKQKIYQALNDLVVSNILKTRNEFGKNKKNLTYYISDLFCYMNLKIIKNNIVGINHFDTHKTDLINGFAFEILTWLNIDLILKEINNGWINGLEKNWKGKESQIDLILDFNKKYSMVECKYYHDVFKLSSHYEKNLISKKEDFKDFLRKNNVKKYEFETILFTVFGSQLTENSDFVYKDINLEKIVKKHLKLNY